MQRFSIHASATSARLDRRTAIAGAGAAALSLVVHGIGPGVGAQGATPAASPAHDDHAGRTIPEIELVATADGLTFPATVAAGLNRVTMRNDVGEQSLHVLTMRIPDHVTDEDLEAAWESETVPDWWNEALFPGNPDHASPGNPISGHVVYQPGRYLMESIFDGRMTRFEVTGQVWGLPAPIADHAIGLVDMTFMGIDAPLPAGPQMYEITNHGTMWHDISVFAVPEGITGDTFLETLMALGEEDPLPDGYATVGGVGAMSPGVTTWVELDLAAGTYVGVCFLPMTEGPEVNVPHAFLGMVTAFEVA